MKSTKKNQSPNSLLLRCSWINQAKGYFFFTCHCKEQFSISYTFFCSGQNIRHGDVIHYDILKSQNIHVNNYMVRGYRKHYWKELLYVKMLLQLNRELSIFLSSCHKESKELPKILILYFWAGGMKQEEKSTPSSLTFCVMIDSS